MHTNTPAYSRRFRLTDYSNPGLSTREDVRVGNRVRFLTVGAVGKASFAPARGREGIPGVLDASARLRAEFEFACPKHPARTRVARQMVASLPVSLWRSRFVFIGTVLVHGQMTVSCEGF